MEWLAIILSGIWAAVSPAGFILDYVVANNLRSRVADVETLAVRIDNTPSHQILKGKIDRVRIASRGLEPIAGFRIALLELETDPLVLDLEKLRSGQSGERGRALLCQPLQVAVRFTISEADLNQALESPPVKERLQSLLDSVIPQQEGSPLVAFTILKLQIDFLGNNRSRLYLQLQPQGEGEIEAASLPPLELELEAGFTVTAGRTLQIIEPQGKLNGRKLNSNLLQGIAEGISEDYLDLRRLETQGLTVRILQLDIKEEEIDVASFIRIEPEKPEELLSE